MNARDSRFAARTRGLLLAVVVGLVPMPARAQTGPERPEVTAPVRPEVLTRVTRALFIVEGEAPDVFFAGLGAEGRDALLAIAADPRAHVGLRRRAVLALHHYAEPVVRAALERLAADELEDGIVSRYALRTLAATFGPSTFLRVADALADPRADVREGAVQALASLDLARAAPLLSARAEIEPERFVRDAIARALE